MYVVTTLPLSQSTITLTRGTQAITMFLENDEFKELQKFTLSDAEWEALKIFEEILEVCFQYADH